MSIDSIESGLNSYTENQESNSILLKLFEVLENGSIPEKVKKGINDFYVAIINVQNGIIGQNEMDNLLYDNYPDFDAGKIKEKIDEFLRHDGCKNLCIEFVENILGIIDKKLMSSNICGPDSNFVDLNDYLFELKGEVKVE